MLTSPVSNPPVSKADLLPSTEHNLATSQGSVLGGSSICDRETALSSHAVSQAALSESEVELDAEVAVHWQHDIRQLITQSTVLQAQKTALTYFINKNIEKIDEKEFQDQLKALCQKLTEDNKFFNIVLIDYLTNRFPGLFNADDLEKNVIQYQDCHKLKKCITDIVKQEIYMHCIACLQTKGLSSVGAPEMTGINDNQLKKILSSLKGEIAKCTRAIEGKSIPKGNQAVEHFLTDEIQSAARSQINRSYQIKIKALQRVFDQEIVSLTDQCMQYYNNCKNDLEKKTQPIHQAYIVHKNAEKIFNSLTAEISRCDRVINGKSIPHVSSELKGIFIPKIQSIFEAQVQNRILEKNIIHLDQAKQVFNEYLDDLFNKALQKKLEEIQCLEQGNEVAGSINEVEQPDQVMTNPIVSEIKTILDEQLQVNPQGYVLRAKKKINSFLEGVSVHALFKEALQNMQATYQGELQPEYEYYSKLDKVFQSTLLQAVHPSINHFLRDTFISHARVAFNIDLGTFNDKKLRENIHQGLQAIFNDGYRNHLLRTVLQTIQASYLAEKNKSIIAQNINFFSQYLQQVNVAVNQHDIKSVLNEVNEKSYDLLCAYACALTQQRLKLAKDGDSAASGIHDLNRKFSGLMYGLQEMQVGVVDLSPQFVKNYGMPNVNLLMLSDLNGQRVSASTLLLKYQLASQGQDNLGESFSQLKKNCNREQIITSVTAILNINKNDDEFVEQTMQWVGAYPKVVLDWLLNIHDLKELLLKENNNNYFQVFEKFFNKAKTQSELKSLLNVGLHTSDRSTLPPLPEAMILFLHLSYLTSWIKHLSSESAQNGAQIARKFTQVIRGIASFVLPKLAPVLNRPIVKSIVDNTVSWVFRLNIARGTLQIEHGLLERAYTIPVENFYIAEEFFKLSRQMQQGQFPQLQQALINVSQKMARVEAMRVGIEQLSETARQVEADRDRLWAEKQPRWLKQLTAAATVVPEVLLGTFSLTLLGWLGVPMLLGIPLLAGAVVYMMRSSENMQQVSELKRKFVERNIRNWLKWLPAGRRVHQNVEAMLAKTAEDNRRSLQVNLTDAEKELTTSREAAKALLPETLKRQGQVEEMINQMSSTFGDLQASAAAGPSEQIMREELVDAEPRLALASG